MCNRYVSPDQAALERMWHLGARNQPRWWEPLPTVSKGWKPEISPLYDAPFFKQHGKLEVGQWGMIPPNSRTKTPVNPTTGKRMSTNNARRERMASAPTYRGAWKAGQRCLIPALSYDEPYWGTGKNIWWRFRRADGTPWALAGLWSEWTEHATGEVVPNFTMITQNCDQVPVLNLMHKPDPKFPPDQQDKRAVVPIEPADWDQWLHGTPEEAAALIRVPSLETFAHGAADPAQQVELPA